MKKMLILAALSSSMIFAAGKTDVTAVAQVAKNVVTQAPQQKASCCPVRKTVCASLNCVKNHKILVGSAVAVAGVAALYYTNASFRAMVRGWLGLDTKAKK